MTLTFHGAPTKVFSLNSMVGYALIRGAAPEKLMVATASSMQSSLGMTDAVPVRLNPLGQNDVNNCLACVAWLAYLAQAQGKLFSVQFGRARRRRV